MGCFPSCWAALADAGSVPETKGGDALVSPLGSRLRAIERTEMIFDGEQPAAPIVCGRSSPRAEWLGKHGDRELANVVGNCGEGNTLSLGASREHDHAQGKSDRTKDDHLRDHGTRLSWIAVGAASRPNCAVQSRGDLSPARRRGQSAQATHCLGIGTRYGRTPESLASSSSAGDAGARALSDHSPLELGHRCEHVQRERGCVARDNGDLEILPHRPEAAPPPPEILDLRQKVERRAPSAVEGPDCDPIEITRGAQHFLPARPVCSRSGASFCDRQHGFPAPAAHRFSKLGKGAFLVLIPPGHAMVNGDSHRAFVPVASSARSARRAPMQ
jgi:hypothetical protein